MPTTTGATQMGTVSTSTGGIATTNWTGSLDYTNQFISISQAVQAVNSEPDKSKIHAKLYFSYVKSKFKLLERMRIDRRIKLLEKAFEQAADAGQDMLGDKVLREIAAYARMSVMSAKGIKWCISKEELSKYKRRIKDGHISDTALRQYTRAIPKDVMVKLDKVRDLFDDFVIYHYWNKKAEEGSKDMSADEKAAMKDPVLFGTIKEAHDKLFFIADWEDEFCDLTFDEMLEAMGKDYDEVGLPAKPELV